MKKLVSATLILGMFLSTGICAFAETESVSPADSTIAVSEVLQQNDSEKVAAPEGAYTSYYKIDDGNEYAILG